MGDNVVVSYAPIDIGIALAHCHSIAREGTVFELRHTRSSIVTRAAVKAELPRR